jgi:hypothetical protein
MAVSPSPTALLMTNFLLNINPWRYTAGGKELIELVQTAASTSGTVTDTEYAEYTQYTAWRYSRYLQHQALTE